MPPPSPLAIATSSLKRLVKEEASYYKELEKQEARLKKTQESADEDGNKEYSIKQEQQAIAETRAVFPSLKQRIRDALEKLRDQVERAQENPGPGTEDETAKAKGAIEEAEVALSAI